MVLLNEFIHAHYVSDVKFLRDGTTSILWSVGFLFLFFVGLAESKFAENTRYGTVATGKPLRPLKHRKGSTPHGLKQANHRTGQNSPYGALQYTYGDSAPFIEFGRGRFTVYAEDFSWTNRGLIEYIKGEN